MFYAYILFSKTRDRYYIGSSGNLGQRVIKHNEKHKGFTGHTQDWQLVYLEEYETLKMSQKQSLQIVVKKNFFPTQNFTQTGK
jgi:putative endonuclease